MTAYTRLITRQEFDDIVALDKHFGQLNTLANLAKKIYGDSIYSVKCTIDSRYNDEAYSVELSNIEAMDKNGQWLPYNFSEDTIKEYTTEEHIQYKSSDRREIFEDMFHYYLYWDFNRGNRSVESMIEDDGYTFSFTLDSINKHPLERVYIMTEDLSHV